LKRKTVSTVLVSPLLVCRGRSRLQRFIQHKLICTGTYLGSNLVS
jgi:hypothetical protein